jgi:hypothetical protein
MLTTCPFRCYGLYHFVDHSMQQQVESETGLIIERKRSLVFLFFSVASVFEKSIAWRGVWVIEMIACTFVRFHVLYRRHRDCAGVADTTTYLLNFDPVRYVLFESCQYPTH